MSSPVPGIEARDPGVGGVYIGLGSNLAQPMDQVRRALAALRSLPDSRLLGASGLYLSSPLGPADQPDYINAVAEIDTELPPLGLLVELQRIEQAQGRSREGPRWGPRTLDLDLLLYRRERLHSPRLRLPHPGLHQRPFVLVPLAEIAPRQLEIPGYGRLGELVDGCPAPGIRRLTD